MVEYNWAVKIRFTPVQRKILKVLSDGLPHSYAELCSCLEGPHLAKNLKTHLSAIRQFLNPCDEDIVCVIYKRKRGYQHVGKIRKGRGGESMWLYKEFVQLVRERDKQICQKCGSDGECVHHIKSWRNHPEVRFEPTNGILLCVRCHYEEGRRNTSRGRPKGSVDDPSKRQSLNGKG